MSTCGVKLGLEALCSCDSVAVVRLCFVLLFLLLVSVTGAFILLEDRSAAADKVSNQPNSIEIRSLVPWNLLCARPTKPKKPIGPRSDAILGRRRLQQAQRDTRSRLCDGNNFPHSQQLEIWEGALCASTPKGAPRLYPVCPRASTLFHIAYWEWSFLTLLNIYSSTGDSVKQTNAKSLLIFLWRCW